MARLQTEGASSFKRARSELSRSTTPAPDASAEDRSTKLPHFLRQDPDEISAKFEEIQMQQEDRVDSFRLSQDPSSPWAQESTGESLQRNRYTDIRPWANSRIHLEVPADACDYINASPITLICAKTGDERRYVAAQGPKKTGVDQFWQMVWQESAQTAVIVMLTQLVEMNREKCYQYLPVDRTTESLPLALVNVSGAEETAVLKLVDCHYEEPSKTAVSKLQLVRGDEAKIIYHLSFTGWPDHGVPEDDDRTALLELIKLSQEKNEGMGTPRIVHCSAGVGRSGTFIALEHLLEELKRGLFDDMQSAEDPVADTVNRLREQRPTMVQSETQFQFLYELLKEEWLERQRARKVTEVGRLRTVKAKSDGERSPKAVRLSGPFLKVFHLGREMSPSRKNKETSKDGAASEIAGEGGEAS